MLAPVLAAAYGQPRLLRSDARRRLAAARLRAAGAAVDLLPAHGLRAPAVAAGDAAGRHLRGDGAAGGGDRAGRVVDRRSARPPATSSRARWRSSLSPYRLGLRFDRAVARRYLRFSAWVFVALVAAMVVVAGAGHRLRGRRRAWRRSGFITLAATLTRYVDRADQIVDGDDLPGGRARSRAAPRALEELFVKSNRATLLYAAPFGVGVVLFAPDLVAFVLGDDWDPARRAAAGPGRRRACSRSSGSTGSRSTARTATRGRPRSRRSWRRVGVPRARGSGPGAVGRRRLRRRADRGRSARARVARALRAARCCRACASARSSAGRWCRSPSAPPRRWRCASALWGGERTLGQALVEALALPRRLRRRWSCGRERACSSELRGGVRPRARAEQGAGQDDGDERQGGHLPVPVDRGVERPHGERGDRPGGEQRIGTVHRARGERRRRRAGARGSATPISPSSANVSSSSECASRTSSSTSRSRSHATAESRWRRRPPAGGRARTARATRQ